MTVRRRVMAFLTAAGRRLRGMNAEASIAGAALVLSLSTVLTSAWMAWRGPEVIAVPPASVFLYRDAGSQSVLTAGVDTALVNAASANFGDVVTSITMEIEGEKRRPPARFRYETLVTPVFTEQAEERMAACPVTARCVRNGQFISIEEPRRTLDVPGGASRSEYVGFVLNELYCSGSTACADYRTFESALAALDRRAELVIRFKYKLHLDGEKTSTCRVKLWGEDAPWKTPWLASHLMKAGWVVLPCES